MFDYIYSRNRIKAAYYRFFSRLFLAPLFYNFGARSKIVKPLFLKNTKWISIGKKVTVNDGVFMMTEKNENREDKDAKLIIADGVTLGNYNHVVALNRVVIGKDVLTADRVYISDNYHGYEDINIPISKQTVKSKGPTEIGEGCWLGENVCVISAKIGNHCVVAANSVVLSDIPDFSIVAGAPAIVKKQFNFETHQWEKC
jgi:serine acetyltransferase